LVSDRVADASRRMATFEGRDYLRTTPAENDRLGREIANKASAARGPTVILLPLGGLSALDGPSQAFAWPEADAALFLSVGNWVGRDVRLVDMKVHINDAAVTIAVLAAFETLDQ
jgi:uncharacterized protein (UPF0261 family)